MKAERSGPAGGRRDLSGSGSAIALVSDWGDKVSIDAVVTNPSYRRERAGGASSSSTRARPPTAPR